MTQTVKFTANSTYRIVASGPTTLVINQVSGVSDLVIKTSNTIPSPTYSNTFMLKSGVIDGSLSITLASGSHAFIKGVSGFPIVSYIKD